MSDDHVSVMTTSNKNYVPCMISRNKIYIFRDMIGTMVEATEKAIKMAVVEKLPFRIMH